MQDIYKNVCYRNGPCLHGTAREVSKSEDWDYKEGGHYFYLDCRLNQKFYSQSPLEAELEENYRFGLSTQQRDHPDLQLADSDGRWFTNTNDPENYTFITQIEPISEDFDEEGYIDIDSPKKCSSCELICDIRDDERYLNQDGSCPYPPADNPQPSYQKVMDNDQSCGDFLHPYLLQDIDAINRRKRRAAKNKLWGYLKQKKWRDILIQKEEPISQVWRRNYRPVKFYYRSFETIYLYLKNLSPEVKSNKHLLQRVRKNIEYSPSYRQCLQRGEWEERMLENIDRIIKV